MNMIPKYEAPKHQKLIEKYLQMKEPIANNTPLMIQIQDKHKRHITDLKGLNNPKSAEIFQ